MENNEKSIVRWIVDTRNIWKSEEKAKDRTQDLPTHVSLRTGLSQSLTDALQASEAFAVLDRDERAAVLKYYFAKDAKMSLASQILKHLAVSRLGNIPWEETRLGKDANKKPCHLPQSNRDPIDFNVSHQAGIVALVACAGMDVDVGVDVVCMNERDEYALIDKDGLFSYIDMHEDVFSPYELEYLKSDLRNLGLSETNDLTEESEKELAQCQHRHRQLHISDCKGVPIHMLSSRIVDAKLRRFYALWCLKEAYIKMTGEALLADWLRQLEFRDFRAPHPDPAAGSADSSIRGESIRGIEVVCKGKRDTRVAIELTAYGQKYMLGTAIKSKSVAENVAEMDLPPFCNMPLNEEIHAITAKNVTKSSE
jgi:4'-phosphopantetheinyl transferase